MTGIADLALDPLYSSVSTTYCIFYLRCFSLVRPKMLLDSHLVEALPSVRFYHAAMTF